MWGVGNLFSQYILIYQDEHQKNHLKAYGVMYYALANGLEGWWLLNWRGGSFVIPYLSKIEQECLRRGVSYSIISESEKERIFNEILEPSVNADIVKLQKAPKVGVYAPKYYQPWDDAVMLALTYAEIPYQVIYDEEVIKGALFNYDWLHLHHEDFTGQYGKFYAMYKNVDWYIKQVKESEETARKLGFLKVSKLKLAVAQKIREYVIGGGYLFAMCSGTDALDIALAAAETDICDTPFDGDPPEPNFQAKLKWEYSFCFENAILITNPNVYEFSDIDATPDHERLSENNDYFVLFEFSAKYDQIPCILTQNHTKIIKGFMGQTTAFRKNRIKSNVIIMGETPSVGSAKYIYTQYGLGQVTYYGGHDPEDYRHYVYDPPTELDLFPNSPGYRLILNNVLFPSAKKKPRKT